jgi:chaperonin GroEL
LLDSPLLVSDGWRIAKGFESPFRVPNLGVRMLQDGLENIHTRVGDGCSTAAILLDELLQHGLRYVAAGFDTPRLCRGMERACATALSHIGTLAKHLEDRSTVAALLQTSGFDGDIAKLIREAFDHVGADGFIKIDESTRYKSELVVRDGMFFQRGLVSSLLATDTARFESHLDQPAVFVTDRTVTSHDEISGMLTHVGGVHKALFIVAGGIEGDALTALVTTQLEGKLRVGAIKAPEYGDQRDGVLEDIAMSTGGLVCRQSVTASTPPEYVGHADAISITRDSTTIVGPRRNHAQCAIRIAQLESSLGPVLSEFDHDRFSQRIGNLRGISAEVRVGGATDVEMGEMHERCLKTLRAIRLGLRSGLVAGAGRAYVQAAATLVSLDGRDSAEQAGIDLVRRALEMPARQLLANAGTDEALTAAVISKYHEDGDDAVYDVDRAVWKHAFSDGLVDTLHAVTEPLRVATSIATLLLNTGAVISDDLPVD